jgi:hypothetical protein
MVTTSLRLLVLGAVETRLAKHPTAEFSLADILLEISVDIGAEHPSGLDGKVCEILKTAPGIQVAGTERWRAADLRPPAA